MTDPELKDELIRCLALQNDIDLLTEDLVTRYATILKDCDHSKGKILVEVQGEIYGLVRRDLEPGIVSGERLASARRHGGFYAEYRLVKIGKPV